MKKLGNVLIDVMQDLSRISTNGTAHVRVNSHLCDPQEFQKLFQYFSKGTLLERLDMTVEEMQPQMKCGCGHEQEVETPDHAGYDRCPKCGQFADIKNDEYQLVSPDPENTSPRKSIRF